MNRIFAAATLMLAPLLTAPAAAADLTRVESARGVAATADALEAAVEGAGATVFARVDHAAGARSAGMDLRPAQLLVFGNPRLGTPAMQDAPEAGLFLPMRVLVHEDADGQTLLVYEDPAAMLGDLDGVAAGAGYIEKMTGALAKLTAKAAGG
ncbi:DUF302 domain-containing protein [Roseovarius salinarum]|uniref:DUF302 domain-containing protein n=1 Tax=Roseovarius salinarum TaxID=1981892 RepID=UPI000C323EB4|nr:DUF302 domain-containing protein [Roseovarius salinarum]